MKYARFKIEAAGGNETLSGVVKGDWIEEYSGDMFGLQRATGRRFPVRDAKFVQPLNPGHIVGIGKNFVAEGEAKPPIPDMPIFFFKPSTTVAGTGDAVLLPPGTEEVKFESELAAVIGKEGRNLAPEDVAGVIFGYTVANDIAALDYFHPEGHWTIGKSFDTFCPLGPVIETEFAADSARIQASVNGVVKQDAAIERIIMPIDRMISYISRFMTLKPGDVILTGTPAGAGMVGDGDVVDCYIEGIGHLRNQVMRSA